MVYRPFDNCLKTCYNTSRAERQSFAVSGSKEELEMYPKMGYKLIMYPKYPTWGTDGVQKLVRHKMVNILKKFDLL